MLLSIQDLRVAFRMGKVNGVLQRADAVKGVSFDIAENRTVALVGESGSGKSVTAMSILNLLPDNAERSGKILWNGKDLLHTPMAEFLPSEHSVLNIQNVKKESYLCYTYSEQHTRKRD